MSFETAKSIIEREISAKDLKLIEFHGGEPLLNFPLIKDICEWFWKTYPELDTKFFLTTNGTQFNESNMLWFEENHKKITYDHLVKNHEAQQRKVVAIKDGKLIGIFRSGKVAQEKTGVPRSGICSACKGKLKTSGGYQWFYEEENDWIEHLNSK